MTPEAIAAILRSLPRRAQVQIHYGDDRVAWETLERGEPVSALSVGQSTDSRYQLQDGTALHVRWFDQLRLCRCHLDRYPPKLRPVAHLFETEAPRGALAGLGLALATSPPLWPVGLVVGGLTALRRAPKLELYALDGQRLS